MASTGTMRSRVKGAICVVAAIQRVRYALNENMSVSQEVKFFSQLTSTAIPCGKKALSVALRRSSVRFAQIDDPFVFIVLVWVAVALLTEISTYKVIHCSCT